MTLRQEKASSGKPWQRRRRGRGVFGSRPDSRIWKVRVLVGMRRVVMVGGRGRGGRSVVGVIFGCFLDEGMVVWGYGCVYDCVGSFEVSRLV